MRVSSPILLALLSLIMAIMLPIGIIKITRFWICGTGGGLYSYTYSIDLSISQFDSLNLSYPGIRSVFILWIFIALIQVLNILISSRELFHPLLSWLVFVPALIAQIYLPSLVVYLSVPIPSLMSQVSQANIVSCLPAALGLIIISFRYWLKDRGNQWPRVGYG
jgi:hypothetical protein